MTARRCRRAGLAALGVLLAAAMPLAAKAAKPLFADDAVIELTIKVPFETLLGMPRKDETAVDGSLAVVGATPETLAVAVSPRGLTRRKRDVCTFPPLRIEFPSKPPAGSLFAGQKRLKLVTHCRSAEKAQQYVLLEYAAYRLYAALTPASFGARLANITYVDATGATIARRLGFFIEAAGAMASRNDLDEFEHPGRIMVAQLSRPDAARFAMFQYMIGNLDWAMNAGPEGSDCCHNARPIGAKGATTGLIPVPYDFDFAGIVYAPYAVPPGSVAVASVRERHYRGFCSHNAEAVAAAANLLEARGPLLAALAAIPQLDTSVRDRAALYLEGFFKSVADPAAIPTKILRTCI